MKKVILMALLVVANSAFATGGSQIGSSNFEAASQAYNQREYDARLKQKAISKASSQEEFEQVYKMHEPTIMSRISKKLESEGLTVTNVLVDKGGMAAAMAISPTLSLLGTGFAITKEGPICKFFVDSEKDSLVVVGDCH
ncbi:MAG: hypothetical protein V4654_06505 [Bdellovibrionota bacterium]